MVAKECRRLSLTEPLPKYEVIRRVEYGLNARGVSELLAVDGISLTAKTYRAVLNIIAEMMIAQHRHDIHR